MTSIKKIVINSPDGQKLYGIEDSEARQEVQDILGGAPEELNSFLEAFEKFKEGNEVLAGLEAGVKSNAAAITAERTRAIGQEGLLNNAIIAEKERAEAAEAELGESIGGVYNMLAEDDEAIKKGAMNYRTLSAAHYADKVVISGDSLKGEKRIADILAATSETAGVMSAEDKIRLNSAWANGVTNEFEVEYLGDGVAINFSSFDGQHGGAIELPFATEVRPGVMSAEDKVKLGETRNFLDRLMAGLGVSDATVVADRIVAAILSKETPTVKAQVDGYNLILEGDVAAADDNLTLGGDNISVEEGDNGMFNLNIN